MPMTWSREAVLPRLRDEAVAFIEELETVDGLSRREALENLCLVLFNSNEFVYVY